MKKYLDSLDGIPVPSVDKREAFADHLPTAANWYKYLPLGAPGQPFYFYLDRFVACSEAMATDAQRNVVPAEVDDGGRNSTETYRRQFGYLAFHSSPNSDPPNAHMFLAENRSFGTRSVRVTTASLQPLPQELAAIARVELTGVIHPLVAANAHLWLRPRFAPPAVDWPEASGGRPLLQKILARCRELEDPKVQEESMRLEDERRAQERAAAGRPATRYRGDPILNELLAPERQRQRGEIRRAIDRVCDFITAARVASSSVVPH